METLSLNGDWSLQISGETDWIPAKVPGSVYADLLRCGRIEDPFYRDNENRLLPLMEHDFVYTRTFSVSGGLRGWIPWPLSLSTAPRFCRPTTCTAHGSWM